MDSSYRRLTKHHHASSPTIYNYIQIKPSLYLYTNWNAYFFNANMYISSLWTCSQKHNHLSFTDHLYIIFTSNVSSTKLSLQIWTWNNFLNCISIKQLCFPNIEKIDNMQKRFQNIMWWRIFLLPSFLSILLSLFFVVKRKLK